MKKTLLAVLFAAMAQVGHAQSIAAGTISLGGSIGYSRSTNKTSHVTNTATTTTESRFSFSPTVGYFVVDNLEVGMSGSYTAYRRPFATFTPTPVPITPTPGTGYTEPDPATNLRVGIFGRYYKMFVEQFGVAGMLSGGYQTSRDHVRSSNNFNAPVTDYKSSGYYAALTPSIIFFPIPKLGISASIGSLGYDYLSSEYPTSSGNPAPTDYENKTSTFGASFGLDQLQFGGTYYFGR